MAKCPTAQFLVSWTQRDSRRGMLSSTSTSANSGKKLGKSTERRKATPRRGNMISLLCPSREPRLGGWYTKLEEVVALVGGAGWALSSARAALLWASSQWSQFILTRLEGRLVQWEEKRGTCQRTGRDQNGRGATSVTYVPRPVGDGAKEDIKGPDAAADTVRCSGAIRRPLACPYTACIVSGPQH